MEGGETCAASVCPEKMAAHYEEAHDATIFDGPFKAKVLDDGSKIVQMPLPYFFQNKEDDEWFTYSFYSLCIFSTAFGGCFVLDLQCFSDSELRFGVRQLGRGPPRHRLASIMVRFGTLDGACHQYLLSRALAADERLGDDALCAGTPPVVGRVDPALLAPTLVLKPGNPPPEEPWELSITSTLLFQVVRDAPP